MDWGPVFISFLLFIFLSPGLLFQLPGKSRVMELGNGLNTSAASILVHTIIFFIFDAVFLVAIGVRIDLGSPPPP